MQLKRLSDRICISHPCPNHPSQSRDLYCETCQELICRDCIVVAHQHQEPKYSFVKDVAVEQKEAVLKELVPVETFAQQARDALATIEVVQNGVISQEENLTQEITASFDALHRVLEEQKQALLVDLREQTHLKLSTIKIQREAIEATSGELQQVKESVYTAVTHDDGGHEFLSEKAQLAAKITEVTNTFSQVSLNPAVEPDLEARVLPPVELERACVSTNYVQKAIPDHQRCSAEGDGLTDTDIDIPTTLTVHLANKYGIPCSGKISVELKTVRDGAIIQPQVTACSPSHYKVSYTPTVRGRHELSIEVNGEHIIDSPFKVFVRIPVSEIKYPVAEITDLFGPIGLHSTAERILVCDYKGGEVAVYDHSFKRVATVGGGSHFTVRKLKGPMEVTTDIQSNIYVTEVKGNCDSLHKFTKDGTHIKTITGTGHKGGQFSFPNGMCIFKDRFLYVCDSNNSRVLVFDLNLKYLSEVSRHFVWPSGLDVDTSGKLYVCDYRGGCISVLTHSGQHLHTLSQHLTKPVNVRILGKVLYVNDANKNCILSFTLSGDFVGSFGQEYLEYPEGLAIDEDGFFYVSKQRKGVLVF